MTTTDRTAADRTASRHMPWCTDHRFGDAGDNGFCTGNEITVGGTVMVQLDQDEPEGEARIGLDTRMDPTRPDTLSVQESQQLRATLLGLELQASASDNPPCPAWCTDHRTDTDGVDGWHASAEQQAGPFSVLVATDGLSGTPGVFLWETSGGFPLNSMPLEEAEAVILALTDAVKATRA